MPAFRSIQQSNHCAREEFLYELKAGPAGGLRPPSGPAATRRPPGDRPHPPLSSAGSINGQPTPYSPALQEAILANPVVIADYDPRWPATFQQLRHRLAATLGPLTVAIEHVGSTAVPGLAAKPIIDLDE
jgi:hypothetical protein